MLPTFDIKWNISKIIRLMQNLYSAIIMELDTIYNLLSSNFLLSLKITKLPSKDGQCWPRTHTQVHSVKVNYFKNCCSYKKVYAQIIVEIDVCNNFSLNKILLSQKVTKLWDENEQRSPSRSFKTAVLWHLSQKPFELQENRLWQEL